ncbi:neural-cadherin-like [Teleopsis dalmanni]|uniref:neural-cadherin-like n=1 Tax=Teleopsis dalmanni TaxID=139649 RepID=UPI0018CDBA62|nr:neural-cadherin-like [Teleopsis dalmanni]
MAARSLVQSSGQPQRLPTNRKQMFTTTNNENNNNKHQKSSLLSLSKTVETTSCSSDSESLVSLLNTCRSYRRSSSAIASFRQLVAIATFALVLVGQFQCALSYEKAHNAMPTESLSAANAARMLAGGDNDDTNDMSLVLPHDTYPGFSIKKFDTMPVLNNTRGIVPQGAYHMLPGDYSKYFTVLDDGVVMTTSDISPLVNRPVNLVVVEETPNSTNTHNLQLYVMHRNDMLRFPGTMLDANGEVRENRPAGTRVRGVPLMQAFSGDVVEPDVTPKKVRYTLIDGNDDKAFALQSRKTKEGDVTGKSVVVDSNDDSGVWLVTNRPLDRELKAHYDLSVQASDMDELDKTMSKIEVLVLDVNDNRPVFKEYDYKFALTGEKTPNMEEKDPGVTWKRFTIMGKVEATDADGDKVAYRLKTPNNIVIIVPQTGEIMLAGEPLASELMVEVEAHDLRYPSMVSEKPAKVMLEFLEPEPVAFIMQHLEHDRINPHSHHREKRRVTRAVRPTKRIEFTEADGDTEGKSVFQLEKETDKETFKIRDDNPWVTVETNGAVRVKKKWDYEELGPEKTIDFWVIITNTGHNGK